MTPEMQGALQGLKDAEAGAPPMSEWVHKKSGRRYIVISHVLREEDLEPSVNYVRLGDGETGPSWNRLAEVFFDGRFERVINQNQ